MMIRLLLGCWWLAPCFSALENPSVTVPGLGTIKGAISPASNTIAMFKKIPYAEPPIKSRRWMPPTTKSSWGAGAILDGTAFGDQVCSAFSLVVPCFSPFSFCLMLLPNTLMYVLAFRGSVGACVCVSLILIRRAGSGTTSRVFMWVCVNAPTKPGTSFSEVPFS